MEAVPSARSHQFAALSRPRFLRLSWLLQRRRMPRGREKLHYLNPVPLHEIYERWIGKYERHRLQALSDLKKGLERKKD